MDGDAFTLELAVPPNTTAEVLLPDGGALIEVGSRRHTFARTIAAPPPVENPKPFFVPE